MRTPSGDLDLDDPAVRRAHRLRRRRRDRHLRRPRRPARQAAASLATVGPAFGRLEKIEAGDRRIVLGFAKNPTSYNTTLRSLAAEGLPRQLLIAACNTLVDGEDFAWLWDVDFEGAAANVERVTVGRAAGR